MRSGWCRGRSTARSAGAWAGSGPGGGSLYGRGLFLVNDELLAPALGLAAGPLQYPWQAHARGLVSHLVLGAATDAALEVLDRVG